MIKNLLELLITKRQKLLECNAKSTISEIKSSEKKNLIDVVELKQNEMYKIEIKDFLSISEYHQYIEKSHEEHSALDLMVVNVFWNSRKKMVNKGIYYIINVDNNLYNILFTDDKIVIGEREHKEIDEREKEFIDRVFGNNQSEIGNYIIKDRCLELYNDGNRYHFSICKNTVQGNYYVKIYDKPRNNYFMLKEEEAYDEISSLKSNLEGIDGIETFLDLNLLNSCVLDELKEKVTGKSK